MPHAAARVWNIVNAGFDGEIEQVRNLKPHQLPITRACFKNRFGLNLDTYACGR
jgi:hypothetical protein